MGKMMKFSFLGRERMSASEKLERRIAHASFPLSQTPYPSPVTPFQMPLSPRQYPTMPGAYSCSGSPYRQMPLPPAPYRQSPTLSPRMPQRPMSLPAPRLPSPRLQGRLSAPAPLQRNFGYEGHCTR